MSGRIFYANKYENKQHRQDLSVEDLFEETKHPVPVSSRKG